ncbi:Type II secretion system pilotin lipoprotein (PulS_OutS) [Izhakiella capsodis]|uniref:Type II secretion system pilotin lipoprotein (PulS_OutS) n=1 Tax=Izhakiella capsodis TaxID=1367852 RepID=A0A1I4WVE1_9GAMM|nr:YacC family pilotin-like protein [Izhakiella capsodis]SFN17080.1 Type II secretion system pilotin lipoprotein (PulS_OutS) [Izhakiella capsodis]
MKQCIQAVLLLVMLGFSASSFALNESEAEDMADLTAVFVYLKNDCGYQNLPDAQIRRALVFFAQQNRWDLSNYNSFNMRAMDEYSYRDLSGIAIPNETKCKKLAQESLGLLAYVK